jgi:lysozyme family protein
MANFETALAKTLINEGGYANDPDDSGGETYKGVSRVWHPTWEGWAIVDKSKKLPNFPKNLDSNTDLQSKIKTFYQTEFWTPIKGDNINNQDIANSMFDFGVNCSSIVSVELTQTVVGASVDGVMSVGGETLTKLNAFDVSKFKDKFILQKINYYIGCVQRKPTNQKFFYGWIHRAMNGV